MFMWLTGMQFNFDDLFFASQGWLCGDFYHAVNSVHAAAIVCNPPAVLVTQVYAA